MTAQVKGFGSRPIAAVGAHAEGPASVPRVRGVHRPLARHRDSGGFAPFPAPSGADRRAAAKHQQRGRSLAFLLHRDARPAGPCATAHHRARTAPAAGRAEGLRRRDAFAVHLVPLKRKKWFVWAKPPFSGPEAVLAYLARYTHRVAIANSRLIAPDERGVTFRYKDYRRNGQERYRTITLSADQFIRRFLARSAKGVSSHPPLRAAGQRRLPTSRALRS